MKNWTTALSNAAMLASAVIGVGLIGGKELVYYFDNGKLSLVLFAVLYFAATMYLLDTARKSDSYMLDTLTNRLFGKAHSIISFVFNASYFVVVAVMLAGAQQCMTELLDIPLRFPAFSMLTALICSLILSGGIERITAFNKIAMIPTLLFVVTAYIVASTKLPITYSWSANQATSHSLQYVGYNSALSMGVICAVHSKDKRTNRATAIIATLLLAAVIAMLLSFPLAAHTDKAMPVLSAIADIKWLYIWGVITVFVAVTTSILANAFVLTEDINTATKDRSFAVLLVMTAATLVSVVGIDALITNCYPLITALCGITLVASVIKRRRAVA